jgi:hypothetical protein
MILNSKQIRVTENRLLRKLFTPTSEQLQQLRRNFRYGDIYFTSMVVYLTTLLLQRLFTVDDRMTIVEWELAGETEVLRENPFPVPLCPPQIQQELAWNRTSLGILSLLLFIKYCCIDEMQIIVWKPKGKHPAGSGRCNCGILKWI